MKLPPGLSFSYRESQGRGKTPVAQLPLRFTAAQNFLLDTLRLEVDTRPDEQTVRDIFSELAGRRLLTPVALGHPARGDGDVSYKLSRTGERELGLLPVLGTLEAV